MAKRKESDTQDELPLKKRDRKLYTRWPRREPPITDFKKVPKGWVPDDHDIDEDDVIANIKRCKHRIEDGIMPQWWEKKLQKYKACQVKFKKEIETVPSDLSPNVATRLMDLRDIRADIEKNGDKRKLLANIDAIIEAYTSKDLVWNDGLVTYWSKGKMISDGPKEFTWEDFEHYSEKHEGHQSFWVEGLHSPGATTAFPVFASNKRAFTIPSANPQFLHLIDFSLRIPRVLPMDHGDDGNDSGQDDSINDNSYDESAEFQFLDDTGAAIMVMYEDDLEYLENKASQVAKIVGAARLNAAFGHSVVIIYRIEVNLRDQNGDFMVDWTSIQVAVVGRDRPVGCLRLSGPWLRHQFFVGTSPNRKGTLCVAKNKTLFVRQIEPIPQKDVDPTPAGIKIFTNPPGYIFATPRGLTKPGTAESPHGGDSDDDIAVTYHTAQPYQDNSGSS